MRDWNWVEMAKVIPEGKSGNCRIEHRTPDDTDLFFARLHGERLSKRTLATLFVGNTLMMSDGDDERATNSEVLWRGGGDILIAGLGIGMVVAPLLVKPGVNRIVVIEKSADVIRLVEPHVQSWHRNHGSAQRGHQNEGKLLVLEHDIFEWKPPKGVRYDTIYFDIWPEKCVDNLKHINRLHQRFKNYKSPDGWMQSWMAERLRYLKRNGRWR